MASDVREYLRAAQAAEIQGDNARAAELLRTAATAYQQAGNSPRAEQMLRHAQRLDARPSSPGGRPDSPPQASRAVDPRFAERGPTLADPALAAWCSFCCRPGREVGALVAGAAGAYICAGCLAHARRLIPQASSSAASLAVGPACGASDGKPDARALASLHGALEAAARALADVASRLASVGGLPKSAAKSLGADVPHSPREPVKGSVSSRRTRRGRRRR